MQLKESRFPWIIFIIGLFAALVIAVVLIEVFMNPSLEDLMALTGILSLTSLGSAAVGFGLYKIGLWRQMPRIQDTLITGYVLAAGLMLFNVWVTARLMFINQHDLILSTILLFFAGGISIIFGFFLSKTISSELEDLRDSAQQLSQGDFSVRVDVEGRDEIAQLAAAFNQMAARLERSAEKERALEDARRNLVAWASHDLRTPLTSLRVMIDALCDGVVTDPDTVSRYLQQSQAEVARMSKLIDDLFELTQLDVGHLELNFESIDLADLISDTLESFAAHAKALSLELEGSVGDKVDLVWADPEKLSRILDNLLSNALRYTPPGGKIILSAEDGDKSTIVEVKDTGTGIDPEHISRIFDPFYRGDKSRTRDDAGQRGVGLGLAIAKGLVEAQGGKIRVVSQPGKGTAFQFSIPKQTGD